MRKRLIEKFTKAKEGSFGYTMTELLVVVAIIAIVAAIAIPSVIAISRALKFKRVNDHAKSIFLAAQQNLTEMRSDGGLKPLQKAGEEGGVYPITSASFPAEFKTEYVYTTTGKAAFELILPAGSVEATVRAEDIVIEYNPITGNVYAVFYCEEDDQNIVGKYSDPTSSDLPRNADGDKSRRKDMMLGYYDGSGLNSSQLELEEVRATVEFVNGEEGIVRVMVPVPDDFFGNLDEYAKAMTINLSVTGEYSMVQAAAGAAEEESGETVQTPGYMFSIPIKVAGTGMDNKTCYVEYGNTIVVEYPIDSLVNYGSFANYSSSTYDGAKSGGTDAKAHLTDLMDETRFTILPGENVTLEAEVKVDTEVKVEVENGILSGVNPMFEYLQPSGTGGYILAVSNGRNLQNLNAIAPTIAKQVDSVVFTSDIYWNDTVSYYNDKYDAKTSDPGYQNDAAENPARALPYFVPIHHEDLFGTAKFIFPGDGDGGLGGILEELKNFFDKIGEVIFGGFNNPKVPSLTDEMDAVMKNQDPNFKHADIQGNGYKVYNLNIDSNAYTVPNADAEAGKAGKFYATGENQTVDYYFSGLFGYVNTPIDGLHVVNPIVKGHTFDDKVTQVPVYGYKWEGWRYVYTIVRYDNVYQYNNPATGALLGVGGYDTVITNCSTYIDKDARGYVGAYLGHGDFSATTAQKWYGVSGEGAVGGLVGYAKSHRAVNGALTNNKAHLAFSGCFAAVPVSGNMRTVYDKDFGYSNGVGAFIGNSQLTNFYNCYASGDVRANGCMVRDTDLGGLSSSIAKIFGVDLDLLYNGRTSWGAGGFVGSSHGTCYTNCFATGDVSATSKRAGKGAGGFVGVMSLDETSAYGNAALNSSGSYIGTDDAQIAQRTVFTNCYAVGAAVTDGTSYENFSGANGRIVYDPGESMTYFIGDYYRLYAPYYHQFKRAPVYGESFYIYRDTYYLSRNVSSAQNNSRSCAEPTAYEVLQNLTGVHTLNSAWSLAQLEEVKNIPTIDVWLIIPYLTDYENAYFDKNHPTLENRYKQLYAEGYSTAEWEAATAATTHPYTLSAGGAVYPFTKLKGMDYYGDWPAKPSDIGVAYYEQYVGDDNTYYIFDKERGDTDTRLALKDGEDVVVKKDGYAIFSASQQDLTVTVGKVSKTLKWSGETFTIEGKKYYSFLFSDELMEAGTAANEFYTAVTARHGGGTTYTMFFNPSVAISHVNPANGATLATKPDAAPKTIYVRSARQFKAIATLEDFWGKGYSYIQQLNIDATQYDDWGTNTATAERKVSSIGNAQEPFQASYSAGYTVEGDIAKQYKLSGFLFADNAAGFFGTIGKDGSIENLIVECDAVSVGGTSVSDVAVLAGRNEGTISNVDMVLKNLTTLTAADNAGLLAGYSSGTVRDCEVSAAAVTVNAKNGGGLIGSAVGTGKEKAALSKSTLALSGELKISGTENSGGLIGYAEHLSLTAGEPLVSLKKVTATGKNAGGLAGWMENSEIKITDAENAVTVTADSITNTNGTAAGVLGGGKTVTLNSADVKITKSISGDVAAGFLGSGTDIDASYCDVEVSGTIQGKTGAAGVAGTIGSQSVFEYATVKLGSGVSASAGDAAGYAVEISEEANVQNSSVTMNGTTIEATGGDAAGYACTLAGYVGNTSGSSVLCSVVGKCTITGKNAAGFACEITDQVSGAFVTPALDSSKYLGNSNKNLVVNGTSSAAGFALTVGEDATVTNCYALNQITGGSVSGFVGTNKGTVTGCMANVTISGGNAFVATNDGTVTRCYGWYGDGDPSKTETNAKVSGKVYSAYFVDLNPVDKEGKIVVLYTPKGEQKEMTANELQGSIDILAGDGFTWYKPDVAGGYESYPYTAMPENMPKYLYPMLRNHYGDWILPPQYAYGVAYYEIHSVPATAAEVAEGETTQPTTTVKLHMVDLSDEKVTEEGVNDKRANYSDTFDNTGTIVKTGYAVFSKSGVYVLSSYAGEKLADLTYTLKLNDSKSVTYDFYELKTDSAKDGVVTIGATAVSKNTAAVQTWFADAINVTDNTYRVRTPEQLTNVAQTAAASFNFSQTHDIAVTDFTTVEKLSGNYAGNGLKLSASGQTKTWMSTVDGTVQNLNLEIPNGVNAPVFGTVSPGANVTLSGLKIGAVGAEGTLANVVSGSMAVPAVSTPAVNGMLFGDKNGTVSTGTIQTDAITVGTKDTAGKLTPGAVTQLFGNVANVTVNGAIETGTVSGKLFGDVSGTVSTGAINVTGTAAQVFGDVTGGSVTVNGGITTAGAAQIFGTVGAEVKVNGLIKTGDLTGNAIGSVSTNMTLNGITVGNIPAEKYVIAEITGGTVSTGAVTVNNVSGQVFGPISGGTVTVGAVSTQAVGTAASGETAGKNANIFGNITGGTATVTSINTYGKDVNGNVFGNIDAKATKVTVTDGISTGAVTGNVFGTVDAEVSTGPITTGNVTGNVFGAVTAKVTANGITAGTVGNVVASAGANSDVSTGAIVITSGQVIGPVSGDKAKVVTNAITVDSVTEYSILAKVEGGTVTLGDITINPVVTKDEEGNEITTYADVPTLIGEVKVGTVSGAKVDLVSANIPGGIFASVASGTVQNFNVTTTGAMNAPLVGDDLGGNLTNLTVECGSATVEGGILVKSVGQKAAVSGCTVKVTGEAKIGGSNAGGLTGSNAGTLTDNTVNIGTLTATGTDATVGGLVGVNANSGAINSTTDNATNVTITTLSGGQTVGGLAGTNSGSISGAEVSATINHTGNGGVTIGGIVGEMTGGSLTNSEASGSINVDSTTSQSGKGNIIGGAVGKAFENTTYSGTTSTVSLSGWDKATLHNAADVTSDAVKTIISPDGNGPIGQFVGYAATGTSFTNCSGNGGSATYKFLGQVQHTGFETFKAGTYGGFDAEMTNTPYTESDKAAYDAAKVQYNAEGVSIAKFNVTLSECYYTNATNSIKQTIDNTKWYSDGIEEEYKAYATELFNPAITYTANSDLTVRGFGTNTSQTLTNWYYKSGENYYPVWYKYEYTDRWLVKYYGVQLWADTNMDGSLSNNERFVNISGRDLGNTDSNKKIDKTLYTLSDISVSDGNYLIVGGGSKALSDSGSAVNFVSSFNTKGGANADLVASIWSNAAGVWSSNGKYLNLNGSVVGDQNTIKTSIARAGASDLAVSLNGGKNLIFRNNAFDVNTNQIGAISLYSVSSSPVYEITFQNDRFGQVIGATDMGAIPAALSEEAEIPAEEIGGETGNNT